ncbi:hypothetical protein BLA60_30375 [Actinophytocola xinjiangensis]|uniref:DUF5313 domain-containing protein n=1 Tax=Actinophytocola xinjiangensis TaxID=485602 RepID=A0A7Z1AVK3_9PSEU|nr:DUF5313 family protein [Actinophytocola xinjiangensis]OLF06848.1 hypothetical protein BLA60_30375 [Actinophytocola xinjiangensis]
MAERPNPIQWLWYAVGGRLPTSLHDWVFADVTARTWVWRHVARMSVLVLPLSAACLLVPGPIGLRLAMALLLVIVGAYFSLSYVEESADLRAVKHGHEPGAAKAVREARDHDAQALQRARYAENFRQNTETTP